MQVNYISIIYYHDRPKRRLIVWALVAKSCTSRTGHSRKYYESRPAPFVQFRRRSGDFPRVGGVRVNLEDTIHEHIPRLAKEMGWSHREALGQLALVYRATQRAEIHEETPARLVTVCALHFDSDEQGERFFTAMLRAQLAVLLADGRIRIRGNGEHIARLIDYRARASKAGLASSAAKRKKLNDFVNYKLTPSQPTANPQLTPVEPSYAPMLPFSFSPKDSLQTSSALNAPTAKKTRQPKPKKPTTDTHRIRLAWEAAYLKRHGVVYLNWDGAHAKFAKSLEDRAERVTALLPAYFALPVQHTFYEGFDSLKAHLNKLHANHATKPQPSFEEQMRQAAEQAAREEQA